MATDLVRWNQNWDDDKAGDEDQWDTPPIDPRLSPLQTPGTRRAARRADRDASRSRAHGDASFAATRESDAADLRQSRWDWGDLQTWMWIFGMCLGFLLFSALIYFMPQGRHNQNDLPAPTPTIRVY